MLANNLLKKDVDEIISFCQKQRLNAKMSYHGFQLDAKEQEIQKTFKQYLEFYENTYREKTSEILSKNSQIDHLVYLFIHEIELRRKHILNSHSAASLTISLKIFLSRLRIGKHIEDNNDFIFKEIQNINFILWPLNFQILSTMKPVTPFKPLISTIFVLFFSSRS